MNPKQFVDFLVENKVGFVADSRVSNWQSFYFLPPWVLKKALREFQETGKSDLIKKYAEFWKLEFYFEDAIEGRFQDEIKVDFKHSILSLGELKDLKRLRKLFKHKDYSRELDLMMEYLKDKKLDRNPVKIIKLKNPLVPENYEGRRKR